MAAEIERFVDACRAAILRGEDATAVRELVAELVSEPTALAAALGEPERAGPETLYRASDLTILNFAWAPWMPLKPHNHNMWSVVGIFVGREDNIFWRRTPTSIEAAGARSLGTRDVASLGPDIIHSVVNPVGRMTRAIHVYGGDFFAPVRPRSEWDSETLVEQPWNMDETRRLFAEADARSRVKG
jgi:predicted metal-dependent enzyme (double-stranded beta helix superfamily)